MQERRMMMKAKPATPFVVIKSQLLLEVLVVPFDAPSRVRLGHQIIQRRIRRTASTGSISAALDRRPATRSAATPQDAAARDRRCRQHVVRAPPQSGR